MAKGKKQSQKSTKADYSELIRYAEQHPGWTRTKVYNEAKKEGIKAQKKGGLEALRIYYELEKGQQRGKVIKELGEGGHYKPPVHKRKKSVGKIKLDMREEKQGGNVHYIASEAAAVKKLKANIRELYGYTGNEFLQVHLVVQGDLYSKHQDFALLTPHVSKVEYNTNMLAKHIIKNLKIYYANLAKKYSNMASYKTMQQDIDTRISKMESDLPRNMTRKQMESFFSKHGVKLGDIKVLRLVKTENKK